MKLKQLMFVVLLFAFTGLLLPAASEQPNPNSENDPEPASQEEQSQYDSSEGEPATGNPDQNTFPENEPEPDNESSWNEIIPESENIPESEEITDTGERPDSESSESESEYLQDEGQPEGENSDSEGLEEPGDNGGPENNPVVENGVVNLPFYDFPDGEIPNDYFIPVDERPEPTGTNGEPEDTPEYWWEMDPEYFYDDEYAYLNSLAEATAEAENGKDFETEAESQSEAESESETEPENEAEAEGMIEPEFEYVSTFKVSKKKFGTKKILHILIAVLSLICGSLGVVIIILSYNGHRRYREAKLETLDVTTEKDKKIAITGFAKRILSKELFWGLSRKPELISYNKTDS